VIVKKMLSQTEGEVIPRAWKNDRVFYKKKFKDEMQSQCIAGTPGLYRDKEQAYFWDN
jgi:hypothetical protein